MTVVRVVGHRRLQPVDLGGVDFGFLEGAAHGRDQPVGLLLGDPALDEIAAHLLDDALTPKRRVQLEFGEPEQGVAEREAVERVGVEDGAEDHGGGRLAPSPAGYR